MTQYESKSLKVGERMMGKNEKKRHGGVNLKLCFFFIYLSSDVEFLEGLVLQEDL